MKDFSAFPNTLPQTNLLSDTMTIDKRNETAGQWRSRRPRPGSRSTTTTTAGRLALFALLASLGACGMFGGPSRPPGADHRNAILFSPNAEPLSGGPLGHPKCRDAISGWFDRVDANHDGIIDRDEFVADAQQQFEHMDLHHAGYVTSADLSEFRAPYEPLPGAETSQDDHGGRPQDGSPGNRRRPDDGGGRAATSRGPSVDTRADPVMSADKTLSFKVTLNDFLIQANENYTHLDTGHAGRLTKEMTAQTVCKDTDETQDHR